MSAGPSFLTAAALTLALLCAAPRAVGAADAPAPEQQVRDVELAFARTMAERDLAGFREFLSADVVFLSSDRSLRGPEEVIAGWAPYFEGEQAPFSWAPERIEVLDSGDLALSTGPVLDPAGATIATFTSVWRRDESGHWRIVFDRGCPVCPAP